MEERQAEWWGGGILLAVYALVGVPVAVAQLSGDSPLVGPGWLWWSCYAGFLLAFLAGFWPHGIGWLTPQRAMMALVGSGIAVFALQPQGFTGILLVFAAATAAHVLERGVVVAIVVVNLAAMTAAWIFIGGAGWEVLIGVAMYAGIHAMSVWAVWTQLRETSAKERLAVAHTELRAATALLAESSRSTERLRIARELHDVLGHQLTALVLELEVAGHHATGSSAEHVERARQLAKGLLGDVRTTVGELRDRQPHLAAALRSMATDLPRPVVHLEVDEGLLLDEDQTTTLIRCAQEVITNAIRHADAAHLWIAVGPDADGAVTFRARDDGNGAPRLELGHGLTGMRERVEQLGGEVDFTSRAGFRVDVRLPLRAAVS